MNEELFDRFDSLTFDDVLIVPGYTEVLPNETDVCVQLTSQIRLNIPILSAAMDTVTEARLADLRMKTRLTRITNAGLIESHPHDVIVTKEAPNYQPSYR